MFSLSDNSFACCGGTLDIWKVSERGLYLQRKLEIKAVFGVGSYNIGIAALILPSFTGKLGILDLKTYKIKREVDISAAALNIDSKQRIVVSDGTSNLSIIDDSSVTEIPLTQGMCRVWFTKNDKMIACRTGSRIDVIDMKLKRVIAKCVDKQSFQLLTSVSYIFTTTKYQGRSLAVADIISETILSPDEKRDLARGCLFDPLAKGNYRLDAWLSNGQLVRMTSEMLSIGDPFDGCECGVPIGTIGMSTQIDMVGDLLFTIHEADYKHPISIYSL
jgi:hypothetical protein